VPGQHVGGIDGVLAGHDGQAGRVAGPPAQPGGDDRGHERQDRWADRRGHDVGRRDLGDDGVLVAAAVDRPVVVDALGRRVETDRLDQVARRAVEGVDELVHDVGEHHLVAGPVQDQPDEPSADVARAEMDRDARHSTLTAFRRS
jgi:hypothetical protein